MKQLVEKYNKKELYVKLMDLERVHDSVCREELWKVLYESIVKNYSWLLCKEST